MSEDLCVRFIESTTVPFVRDALRPNGRLALGVVSGVEVGTASRRRSHTFSYLLINRIHHRHQKSLSPDSNENLIGINSLDLTLGKQNSL